MSPLRNNGPSTRPAGWLHTVCILGSVLAAVAAAGCASPERMSPQQREGVEMRRWCEQHPEEVEKCIGFLGWR